MGGFTPLSLNFGCCCSLGLVWNLFVYSIVQIICNLESTCKIVCIIKTLHTLPGKGSHTSFAFHQHFYIHICENIVWTIIMYKINFYNSSIFYMDRKLVILKYFLMKGRLLKSNCSFLNVNTLKIWIWCKSSSKKMLWISSLISDIHSFKTFLFEFI